MFKQKYTQEELNEILAHNTQRKGWDFSSMKTESQTVPWDYLDEVALYLNNTDTVLDIGTGGGEKLLSFSDKCQSLLGIDDDEEMIRTAQENGKGIKNVQFCIDSEKLENTDNIFDVILNRHAPFNLEVIHDHLKDGGYFLTQQVGEKNMLNIKQVLNQIIDEQELTAKMIEDASFKVIASMEYNVDYIVKDAESLVFWLQALDRGHSDMDGTKAFQDINLFNKILNGNVDSRGFVTNEHRYMFIAQK